MLTYRQRLIELVCEDQMTLRELSAEVKLPIKEVLGHLEHVRKSIRPPLRFNLEPAECLECGFVFKDRRRLNTPSKCPRCKSNRIQEPEFSILS
ncbi:transcriptional regulator [Thermodesulfobacteriota bacterium]